MPRYIDVEPFDVIAYETKGKEEWTEFDEGVSFILDKIDNAPTADVVEVVYGRWERSKDDYFELHIVKCSVCREEWCFEVDDDVFDLNYHYCPNCGAKMDGERRNDEQKTDS